MQVNLNCYQMLFIAIVDRGTCKKKKKTFSDGKFILSLVYSCLCMSIPFSPGYHISHMQGQLRSADVRILRQLLSLHESMEMLRWLQGDRSTLTSLTSSLTGSQSSLGEVANMTHGPGGESPSCCPSTPPGIAHTPCPSPSGATQCSTSFEDSSEISDQAWSTVSRPTAIKALSHEDGPADLTGQTAVLERPNKIDSSKDLPKSDESPQCSGLPHSKVVKGEVMNHNEGSVQHAQEEPELSLGQSEALLGYDTHWCWVESKDDVTFHW